ncbi:MULTISPECIES: 7-carboxy-7-deazaguanine synthase QueE [Virgibacillus]|uniref:7-carboxy-7-deazaguanine synthase n=2 Tax=Virgibacillus TaxID=84406 RepID=A0A024QEX8_9BACI|nr:MULTISPECIES: 7-carboxy-7-deazaguanine synthase QueE [Virgibacillus]EQB35656.1 7-carboxy-7-deazaguanine synthase [Virgibacillus sp. CM-4]MYL42602.1 7-carboxy-7-deazaguanine synthase QueE [Virgibacillus massiliensis]GGJ73733.1 7-carboxy-7-deazaguanine synthase [Virgibacillus kapii]CDQ40486.1 7-carboxy-7-deazaguanine synthase [Virgibacillus massiliensis]
MKIPVIEVFGPTIQGEGMVIGRKTMFVRTAGCDYSCSWCDSKFTWDGTEKHHIQMMEAEEIMQDLREKGADQFGHVTISGGNPGLLPQIDQLIDILHDHDLEVALETQGSRWQTWFTKIDDLTLSPKPPSSGMKTNYQTLDFIIDSLKQKQRGKCSLKVVIFNEDDLGYAENIHQRYPDVSLYLQVGNDEITMDNDQALSLYLLQKYEELIDQVMVSTILKDVRVLPQLHTFLWGNKRGV